MNFKALKTLITSLTTGFKCQECSSNVGESNIDIIGAAGNTINIDITCPKCSKHSMVKSEVVSIDPTKLNLTEEQLKALNGKSITQKLVNTKVINDSEIGELNNDLKKEKLNVSDFFGE